MTTSIEDNSKTGVIDSELTLETSAITTAGSYILAVDMNALALGDTVTLRIKTKVRSTGTTRLAYQATYSHVQAEPVKMSIPVASTNEVTFTLEQTAGTGRAFPWEIMAL